MIIIKKIKFHNKYEFDFSNPISILFGLNGTGKTSLLNLLSKLKENAHKIRQVKSLTELDGEVIYELNPKFFEIETHDLFINQSDEITLITDAPETMHLEILGKIKRKLNIYHWDQSAAYTVPITYFFDDKKPTSLSEARLNLLKSDSERITNNIILLDQIASIFSESQREQFISTIEVLSNLNQIIIVTNRKYFETTPNFQIIELNYDFADFFYEEIFPKIYEEEIFEDEGVYDEFLRSIQTIKNLLNSVNFSDSNIEDRFYNLLFANIITSMESYLSDMFINTVLRDEDLILKLLKNSSFFNEKKYKIGEAYMWLKNKQGKIQSVLSTISFHNLKVAQELYEMVLGISFPEDREIIEEAVEARHAIVHRNGRTRSGDLVEINLYNIKETIDEIKSFISEINDSINETQL